MSTLKGTVKWFNSKKGFGFIEREDKEKDAFVHASAVKTAGMRFLNEGDKIIAEGLTKVRPGMKVKPIIKSQ